MVTKMATSRNWVHTGPSAEALGGHKLNMNSKVLCGAVVRISDKN